MWVEFRRLAEAEVRAAEQYYRRRSPHTASRFRLALDDLIGRIAARPSAFAPASHGTRFGRVHKFPYTVYFLILPAKALVIAVSHNRRRPGYWSRRLSRYTP